MSPFPISQGGAIGVELPGYFADWSQNDEDKWGEVVSDIEEEMKSEDSIFKIGKGETVLRMVACIAVATK
jgi:hypothetical protein